MSADGAEIAVATGEDGFDFFMCGLELRPELFQILEGQGRAFWVSRPWALVEAQNAFTCER